MSKINLPSKNKIKKHWEKYIIQLKDYDSKKEYYEADYCFACGCKETTERAHIKARCNGGSDKEENLHLLCNACHKCSEFLEGKEYYSWLINWNVYKKILYMSMKNNPAEFIEKLINGIYKL